MERRSRQVLAWLVLLVPTAGQAATPTPAPPPGQQRPDAGHAPPAHKRPDTGHFPPAKQRPDSGHTPSAAKRPDTGHAPPLRVKVSLACTTQTLDGTTLQLPARDVRLETPIHCVLAAGPHTAGAGLTGVLRTKVDGKIRSTHAGPLAGDDAAAMHQELVSGEDYDTCMRFAIEAEVRNAAGKTLGRKKIVVAQSCPD